MELENNIDRQSLAQFASRPAEGVPQAADVVANAHAAGRIRLSGAGGFVSPGMQAEIARALPGWNREPVTYCVVVEGGDPFNVGLDMQGLRAQTRDDRASLRAALGASYALAWDVDCFGKPIVSLMNGRVTGAGIGMSLYGTHRVGGERFRWAVTGPRQDWFPDHGVARALTEMPGHFGVFLALTGQEIGRADAYRLGLLTHCIPAEAYAAIGDRLSDADPVDPILDTLHEDPGPGLFARHIEAIDRCFSAPTLEEILSRLDAERGASAEWAHTVWAGLASASPLLAGLAMRVLREGKHGDLRDALIRDYRIAARLLEGGERHADDGAATSAFLASLGAQDLQLAVREDLQSAPI